MTAGQLLAQAGSTAHPLQLPPPPHFQSTVAPAWPMSVRANSLVLSYFSLILPVKLCGMYPDAKCRTRDSVESSKNSIVIHMNAEPLLLGRQHTSHF
jgi:hypothetical protein